MKFRVEGLDVEIGFAEDIKAKRVKVGDLLQFKCKCGFETIKIRARAPSISTISDALGITICFQSTETLFIFQPSPNSPSKAAC